MHFLAPCAHTHKMKYSCNSIQSYGRYHQSLQQKYGLKKNKFIIIFFNHIIWLKNYGTKRWWMKECHDFVISLIQRLHTFSFDTPGTKNMLQQVSSYYLLLALKGFINIIYHTAPKISVSQSLSPQHLKRRNADLFHPQSTHDKQQCLK